MKTIYLILSIIFLSLSTTFVYGQENKKEVRKEFRMEDNDGIKTLYVTTVEDGKVTEEVFKGDEAEAKLKELMVQEPLTQKEIKKEVEVRERGGKKTVTIKTTENGITTEEVFTGNEAEKKLKEIGTVELEQEQIVVEETVIKTKKKKKRKKSK
jgi:hypothetical protein